MNKQFEVLVKLGILIPFDEKLHLYHGRARVLEVEGSKNWQVDQFFDNASNNTGNHNMHCLPVLYTCKLKQAELYAYKRAAQLFKLKNKSGDVDSHFQPETFRILPLIDGKYFINGDFDLEKLNNEQIKIVKNALKIPQKENSVHASTMSQPTFFEKEYYHEAYKKMSKLTGSLRGQYIDFDDVNIFCAKTGYDYELAERVAGTLNSVKALNENFVDALVCVFSPTDKKVHKKFKNLPLDAEYILSWAKENSIIGFSQKIYSHVVQECLMTYAVFNESQVGTEKQIWKREINKNKHRKFSEMLGPITNDRKFEEGLLTASPQEAVESLENLNITYNGKSYKTIFGLSANVTPEKFTVGEHTETVLRVFEDSFKEQYADEILPFVKLVLLCHDIGKGFTQYAFDPRQKEYNARVAEDFLSKMGVCDEVKKLILFVIGDSQRYTHQYIVNRDDYGKKGLQDECREVLKNLGFGFDKYMVSVLSNICLTLQSCDGGAYTTYAVTRDTQDHPNAQYKNFNERFSMSYVHSNSGAIIAKALYEDEEKQWK